MWDKRYSTEEYVYGTEPNDFLKANYKVIPKGKVLCLAEGEGRNAVFLAEQGYSVTAVDSSSVGLRKAEKLAHKRRVQIECIHGDLEHYIIEDDSWDGIVSIFCHLPIDLRKEVYRNIESGLKEAGVFLTEGYSVNQLKYGTGGAKSEELLLTTDIINNELPNLNFKHLEEIEREVIEGFLHNGFGSVVQGLD